MKFSLFRFSVVSLILPILLLSGCASGNPEMENGRVLTGNERSEKMVPAIPPASPLRLPKSTVFKGEGKFYQLVARAEKENWHKLPLGRRTATVGKALLGTPYVNYTLEIDDHIEAPSVNFNGLDCWTFYEIALGFARMLKIKDGGYRPEDLLHMVEVERYRNGRCTGDYLSRMHFLEEVFYDNEKRGLAINPTRQLGGVRLQRQIREMTVAWKSYRYLKNNPELRPRMSRIENQVSALPVYHIPKSRVASVEPKLQTGDIIAITTTWHSSYTSHVGLAYRDRNGVLRFMHATSERDKGRKVILDRRLKDYLYERKHRAGIIVCRPKEIPMKPAG